ncbi:adenosylhomocysteinase [Thermococci archaeon]|nr:MAG: adenosylhomocysteinase [Thermococci archaeon]
MMESGLKKIRWAEKNMKVLGKIRRKFSEEKPFDGIRIGIALHLEAKTAVLIETLVEGGAEVYATSCNPLTTQDDVAMAISEIAEVRAWRGETEEEYYENLRFVLRNSDFVIDDGADLIVLNHLEGIGNPKGACEETTTGIRRVNALERERKLKFPVIGVNDSKMKYLFDNRFGTGQSVIDGIMRSTNSLLAGKNFVVIGYGWCGRGIAMRARGMGAKVIVCEVDPVRAVEALLDGFEVMKISEASRIGDFFVTATGCKDVLRREHFLEMREGAILANAGHFNVEINLRDLEEISTEIKEVRNCVREYRLRNGRRIYLLGEGRLVNLVCGDGHPIEIMDISFSLQALSMRYLSENYPEMENRVYEVPKEIEEEVALEFLMSRGKSIDSLTEEQAKYLEDWTLGT